MLSQWNNKKVAFLGDSITDAIHVGTTKNYWQFLQEELAVQPLVYAKNGARWKQLDAQIDELIAEHGNAVDAIFIFAGTNDYNGGTPLGEWYTYNLQTVNVSGVMMPRKHRNWSMDDTTLRGIINHTMKRLKAQFPTQQIVLLTPIHRAFATFGPNNVQPDENYANANGLFVESYVEVIRQAADIWACPLIDLYRNSGLHPLTSAHGRYFHDANTDRLHPNITGHDRIAQTLIYQLTVLPSSFN